MPAHADRGSDQVEMAVLLGQQCVAEISLSPRLQAPRRQRLLQKLRECDLMWHILASKVEYDEQRLRKLVARYNTLFKRRSSVRAWVFELDAGAAEPPSWSQGSWERHRDMWETILTHARSFLEDPGAHPCPSANHFGGRCDDDDHACDPVPVCWQRQWCGRAPEYWSQAYWRRPPGGCPAAIPATEAAGG